MKHQEMIMVIEAHSEGKKIECQAKGVNGWSACPHPIFNFSQFDYRVKPELKYKTITPASYLQESGCIDFSAEYVEIKALEDALGLLNSRGLTTSMPSDQYAVYVKLLGLYD